MLEKVISGFQTGADQGAMRAAKAAGIPTGGWMPKGFLTEDGARPEFAELYGTQEMDTDSYRARTEQNVRDSHGTLWFGTTDTPGAKATLWAAHGMNKPIMLVRPGTDVRPSDVVDWIRCTPGLKVLNVAGNRESKAPGIGDRVEGFLAEMFRRLADDNSGA
jgi:hypothetical protein